jgi:hypothetical protein
MKGRSRRAVPLRRVIPWWYVAGALLSIVVITASGVGQPAVSGFWGPVIGNAISDRLGDARARADDGRDTSRRALLGPAWLEPVLALLLASFAVGLSFLLGAVFDDVPAAIVVTGVVLCVVSAGACLTLVLVLRGRARRAAARGDGPAAGADDGTPASAAETTSH